MNRIGFKCSWIQDEPETQQLNLGQAIVTPSMEHMADIQLKVDRIEQFMTTTKFAKLKKQDKLETIQSYNFLLKSLMMIQPSSGMIEFGSLDIED